MRVPGPGKKGPHSPFFQSERLDLYKHYAKKLPETYNFSSTQLPTRLGGVDLIFGQLKDAHASLATDPILLKLDLFPTYHLVVDDHEIGMIHVLRAWRGMAFFTYLNLDILLKLQPPQFAHLPIVFSADGSKMSKRNGDIQVDEYTKRGWECIFALTWLAGWGARHDPFTEPSEPKPKSPSPSLTHSHQAGTDAPDSTAVYTLPQLISEFDLTSVTHRNSTLDPMKLEYLNKQHLLHQRSTSDGSTAMGEKVHDLVKGGGTAIFIHKSDG
ncbi:hypothetical protein EST38_g14310 [Candolleomyces aberdarensis]|uniref:Glutamyl/glutaminyl-tRNA synthetase class Ib catalytic domain-containing protein n=1 Tax=Candolleomyces aberdarensis TaxID=2316362 RepID=A0A4Q2CZF6_9AGAR|nr:hypothetical protein EST38_g14310 [Candolleomyces aberdarensis]